MTISLVLFSARHCLFPARFRLAYYRALLLSLLPPRFPLAPLSPPLSFFPPPPSCPLDSPNHQRGSACSFSLAGLSQLFVSFVYAAPPSVDQPRVHPSTVIASSSSRRFDGFFVHDNCSESGFLFFPLSIPLHSSPESYPIASLNRRNYPRITVSPHRPEETDTSSSPLSLRFSLPISIPISFPENGLENTIRVIYYSEKKRKERRLFRKKERKELRRRRVSSARRIPKGRGRQKRIWIPLRRTRGEHIATRADVTVRARRRGRKMGEGAEERRFSRWEEKEGKNAIAFRGWKS